MYHKNDKHDRGSAKEYKPALAKSFLKQAQRVPITAKINIGLLSGLIILLVVGLISYTNMRSLTEALDLRRHNFELRIALEKWLADMLDAETGQRGFLLTGRDNYLEPYTRALSTRESRLQLLRQLATNDELQARIVQIDQLFTQRLQVLNEGIALRRDRNFTVAQANTLNDKGKLIMDQIRARLAVLDAERGRAIERDTARITELQLSTTITIIVGTSVAGLIVGFAIYSINRDLRARRRIQDALGQSEAKLRAIIDNMAEGLVAADNKGNFVLFNKTAEKLLGVGIMKTSPAKWSEIYGNYLPDKITPFPTEQFPLLRALKGEEIHNVQIYVKNKKLKSGKFIIVSGSPLRDQDGTIIGSIAVFNDITPQKNIEEKLFSEKIKAETTLNSIGDGVFVLDTEGRVVVFNKAAEKITGFGAPEILGKPYRDVLRFRDVSGKKAKDAFITEARTGKQTTMTRHTVIVRKDGLLLSVADSAAPIFDAAGEQQGIIVVFRDITDQEQFERDLEASNQRFELAARATSDVMYDLDINSRVMVWNEALHDAYGYRDAEKTNTLEWWTQHIHPDDAMRIEGEITKLLNGVRKTGVYEYRFRRADGTYAYVRDRLFIQRDENHMPVRLIGSLLDITKQKELDRAKGEFISLVSHQLRTPLTAIRLFTEMLVAGQVGKLTEEQQDYIEKVDISTKRMIQLVGDILNISRVELGRLKIEPVATEVNKLIQSHIEEIKPLAANKNVKIKFKPVAKLPQLSIDRLLFGQIVHNLMTNAVRYSHDKKGIVTIAFTKQNDGYLLSVKDNGIGIPQEAQSHIFQRFYRANNAIKIEGEGTGLGLYLVKLITEASGGKVWFESSEGKGTTFYIKIPNIGMKPKQGDKSLN